MQRRAKQALATHIVAASLVALFSVHADAGDLLIKKGPYIQALGASGVTIKVELNKPENASIEVVGPDAKIVRVDDGAKDFHVLRVEKLTPGTSYAYKVIAGSLVESGAFTTSTLDAKKVRFIAYGDNRSDRGAHASVVRALLAAPGEFLVNTGDMVASGSDSGDWQTLFEIEKPLLSNRCVFVAIGNHELYENGAGQAAFLKYFASTDGATERPTPYGSFRWGATRFFLLNAMDDWTGDERAWLKAELDRALVEPGLEHRIAVLHWAPFSSGPHGNNPALARGHVVEMMKEGKIDLILGGHDHVYERGEGLGVKYLITGGGGAPLYPKKRDAPETQRFESVHHYLDITIDGPTLRAVARRASGTIIEDCSFSADAPWACDPSLGPTATTPPPAPPPAKIPGPQSASACACRMGGTSRSSGGAAVLFAACLVAALARTRNRRIPSRRMARVSKTGLLFVATAVLAVSAACSTYRQDLDRAQRHYDQNQYEAALALFRVLEPDLDSFSTPEQAQYAYLRGMTDFRLSSIVPAGTTVSDPRKSFRDNARHWLSFAAAIEKTTPGGLTEDQKGRLGDAMKDLNHDWYAGAEEEKGDAGAAKAATDAPDKKEEPSKP